MALEEYLQDQLGSKRLAQLAFGNRIFDYFAAATPGARELATIGKIWDLAQLERRHRRQTRYDLVVVDAPASGHGLGLLGTPRTFREAVKVGPIARQAGNDPLVRHGPEDDRRRRGRPARGDARQRDDRARGPAAATSSAWVSTRSS